MFVILGHFFPFYATNNPKNETLKKWKNIPRDLTILHLCTTNDTHMMFDYNDMEHKKYFL